MKFLSTIFVAIIAVSIIAIIILLPGIIFNKPPDANLEDSPQREIIPINNAPEEKEVNFNASFTIITFGLTRTFKDEKYHNKSEYVYIEPPDHTIVHVKKKGVTWDYFFKTLPMSLTKTCLTTGDGETYCNGKNGTLKFFLNGIENKDLLDREIKEGDKVLVSVD